MATQQQIYDEIRRWCHTTGLKWKWIDKFPDTLFADIRLLQLIRTHYFPVMSRSEQAQYHAIWSITTKKQRQLSRKNLIKLQKAIEQAHIRRHTIHQHRHQVTQTGT